MILRVEFLRGWIEQGAPSGYWINAFFFPQGFLTAVLQGYSRKNQVPVDVLGFESVVQDFDDSAEIESAPEQYSCPLYKTSVRAGTLSTTGHSTNFVLPIEIDTAERPSHWILKGAAFLCMLND